MKPRTRLVALVITIMFIFVFSASVPGTAGSIGTAGTVDVVLPDGSYCLDKTGVILEKTKDYITERNYNLEKNCKGAQICVVVISTIGGEAIDPYANGVFEEWRIGRAGEDNGALILFAIDDADYTIVVGKGLETVFTAKVLTDIIINHCEPYFSDGDYDSAVREAFRKLNESICRHYNADPSGYAEGDGFTGGGAGRPWTDRSRSFFDSCRRVGQISFAACSTCVAVEFLSSIGGED